VVRESSTNTLEFAGPKPLTIDIEVDDELLTLLDLGESIKNPTAARTMITTTKTTVMTRETAATLLFRYRIGEGPLIFG